MLLQLLPVESQINVLETQQLASNTDASNVSFLFSVHTSHCGQTNLPVSKLGTSLVLQEPESLQSDHRKDKKSQNSQ